MTEILLLFRVLSKLEINVYEKAPMPIDDSDLPINSMLLKSTTLFIVNELDISNNFALNENSRTIYNK